MSKGKIIITGPGRSGTTFIVQLLTRLGFDTGFKPGKEAYRSNLRAGCELTVDVDLQKDSKKRIRRKMREAPRVLKSPEWGMILKGLLSLELIDVDHVILPVRDLDISAKSRLDVGLDWCVDPTLEGEERRRDQASILALSLGRTIEACLLWSVPCIIMAFPLLVEDEQYCYDKLHVLGGIDRDEFGRIFRGLAKPEQIKW